eukprot:CAMPEP_0170512696 /NCGR_PEP_ID=MMETSP0208-20121228/66991_1 /TAXON_ID=197538 /ORGANISM="Strombidium inclinatum, Strain S3" /LENGTH=94 /DNA_ID=CAMNT_0010796355 /DNA_START=390 /DNA_END=670 /DNA_ORIENTATION=+
MTLPPEDVLLDEFEEDHHVLVDVVVVDLPAFFVDVEALKEEHALVVFHQLLVLLQGHLFLQTLFLSRDTNSVALFFADALVHEVALQSDGLTRW